MYIFVYCLKAIALLCFLYDHVNGRENARVSERIIDGREANIEDFPYFASLQHCGAAILSDRWIVTAAHCVPKRVLPGRNNIWVGGETLSNSKLVRYDRIVVHPECSIGHGFLPTNDIALLRLTEPLTFSSKIRPVELPTEINMGYPAHEFVGRGTDETGRPSTSLKKMEVTRLTTEECVAHLPPQYQEIVKPHLKFLETINVCAKRPDDSPGLCFGDSGSPLVQKNTLVGLASYIGHDDCSNLRLGFYVNVLTYVPWINSVTGLK